MRGTPFDAALRILTLRDHSEAELARKLAAKGCSPEEVGATLERLKELGYLDDRRFARRFAESALENGRYVGARLKQELARRGVAAPLVEETLQELDQRDEEVLLAELVARRYATFDPATASDKEKRRVIGFLSRKGFSLGAIFRHLKANPD